MWKGVSKPVIVKSIGDIIKGEAPKRTHLYVVFSMSFVYVVMISIAQSLFPAPGYSLLNNVISDMGGIATNPAGWWVFDITEITLGILMIPHYLYLYRRLHASSEILAKLALIAGIVGCAGFANVGLFPQDIFTPHGVAAITAFSGFTVASLLIMIIFIQNMMTNAQWPSKKQFWLLYGPLFVTFPLIFVMPILGFIASSWPVDLRWFSWAPWQWTFMFSLMYWMIIIALIMPDRPSNATRTTTT